MKEEQHGDSVSAYFFELNAAVILLSYSRTRQRQIRLFPASSPDGLVCSFSISLLRGRLCQADLELRAVCMATDERCVFQPQV